MRLEACGTGRVSGTQLPAGIYFGLMVFWQYGPMVIEVCEYNESQVLRRRIVKYARRPDGRKYERRGANDE
ncbi:MAG: hypothetical protein OEM26_20415 [Saprospiraceae bacterium]|nr:hypothetical protein [Saprospiraceae bacterium]